MKKNIKIFLLVNFLCGICTFTGSVLGNAFGNDGLFIGAVAGGILSIPLSTSILCKTKVIERQRVVSIIVWGILFFLSASLFAVTNLNSPVIPLLSLCFVGAGCLIGNYYIVQDLRNKNFNRAVTGFLLLLPAVYFVVGSVIKYNLDFSASFTLLDWFQQTPSRKFYFNMISPVIFIGGALMCVFIMIPGHVNWKQAITSWPVFVLSIPRVNLIIAVAGLLVLSLMGIYVVLENL